jgi:hypothetical protein
MRSLFICMMAAMTVALSGCASTFRSNVTTFHQWPENISEKSFVFQRSPEEEASLEYQHYEDQVRIALEQLGFSSARTQADANMIVDVDAGQTVRDVTVIEPVVPDPFWYGSPFYGPGFGPFGYYGVMSPFWLDPWPYHQREVSYPAYQRRLKVSIMRAEDGKKLYEGTATSRGRNPELAEVMPYMVDTLFKEFPGPSGVPRRVEVRVD